MGCGTSASTKEGAKKPVAEPQPVKKAAVVKPRDKYTEAVQKECAKLEASWKLSQIDWKAMVSSAETVLRGGASEDVDNVKAVGEILTKAGLPTVCDGKKSQLYQDLSTILVGADGGNHGQDVGKLTIFLTLIALLYCKGDPAEKAEKVCELMLLATGGDASKAKEAKTINGPCLREFLTVILEQAANDVPRLLKSQSIERLGTSREHANSWWRHTLKGEIPKEWLVKWFKDGKFTAAEARDAVLRKPLPEFPPEDDVVAPKETSSKVREYSGESQKACLAWETALEFPDWANVADSGEYFTKTEKEARPTDEEMLNIITKSGFREDYDKNAAKIKGLIDGYLQAGPDDFLAQWTYFCAFICPGNEADKAAAVWRMITEWRENGRTTSNTELRFVLRRCIKLAVVDIPAAVGANAQKDYLGVDLNAAGEKWWGRPMEARVKKEDFFKWFMEKRFCTAEAREAAKK